MQLLLLGVCLKVLLLQLLALLRQPAPWLR